MIQAKNQRSLRPTALDASAVGATKRAKEWPMATFLLIYGDCPCRRAAVAAAQECLVLSNKKLKTRRIVGTVVRQDDLSVRSDKFDGME
jgi:hypothetical protein